MIYRIEFKKSVLKFLATLDEKYQKQISKAIDRLSKNPHPQGSLKLSGFPYYRMRVGRYRIIYEIQDDVLVVVIMRIAHRKDVYHNQ